ncbi:aminotransferase class I/II-fold pyridoxal phosphate-dependent enzyme [Pedobacter frigidisoli]|uniref:Aminotransferase class I/II-fold pyridoxal phosphate-dependent enzyme n=1 Tax=Pedobacter frigidisoli TaxID=2530455 RepID=A0A4R0P856_9SPHI|nr:aminotransferase class I/II-fold pyridoxal phosphate-dependent enzyme [Pedobacter frigidisoli]TCD11728.1 aminotransferase class I/II-fold pyridoxal phosphate-dependent enzyme [Pedobacter frigidisoli]
MNTDFRSINQPFSNSINFNGKTYLYFGGTAYLGIPQNAGFINLYIEGIKKYGLNNGTSRSNNIQLAIYEQAEEVAAKRFQAESALITSSGYLAAQLTVKELSTFGKVIYAPATHPALWLDGQPINAADSLSTWKTETINFINESKEENWVLISNSMNNLFPEIYDFDFVEEIHPDKNVLLVVDDSHGIGVNNNGIGAFTTLPKRKNIECVVVASMAKALGVDAGLVLGSKKIINQLKNTNTFVGASPPAAAGIYAFIHAEEIYRQAWEKLQKNINSFSKHLNTDWKFENGFPAFFINDSNLADDLMKNNILISSFPYPNADSEPINRIVLSSWHMEENIETLISALHKKSLYQ